MILLIVTISTSKFVHELLTQTEELDLLIVGNYEGHGTAEGRPIEPLDAGYVWRYFVSSYVVEFVGETSVFS